MYIDDNKNLRIIMIFNGSFESNVSYKYRFVWNISQYYGRGTMSHCDFDVALVIYSSVINYSE